MGSASRLSAFSVTLWLHIYILVKGIGLAGCFSCMNNTSASMDTPLASYYDLRSEVSGYKMQDSNVIPAAIDLLLRDLRHCLVIVAEPYSNQAYSGEVDWLWLRRTFNRGGIPIVTPVPDSVSSNRTAQTQEKISSGCEVTVMFASDNWQTDNSIIHNQFFANSRFYFLFLDVLRKRPINSRIQELLTSPKWKKTQRILMLTPTSRATGEVDMYGRCLHCAGGEVGVEHLESWTPERGFLKPVSVLSELLSNFHGYVFKTVTMDFAPFIDYSRTIDGPGGVTIPKDSMDIRILQEAARLFNFSFILREPADNQWGYLLENGSWTGTVGAIQRSEADFSMMLSVTWERTYAVSFTRAYYVEPMTFVMRKPGPLPQWQAPIKPFTWAMWIYLAVVTILSGPALWLIFRLGPKTPQQEKKSVKVPRNKALGNGTVIQEQNLSFGDICLYMIAPILAQPSPISLRSSSGRAFCGLWWFFCILTTTLYRGSLIARITVPELSPTLDTLEQLADSRIEWGMLDTYGSGYQLFRASTVPVYMKLFEKMHFYNEQISMGMVLRGEYAFISWKTYFRNLIARDYTNKNGETKVRIARQEFFPGGFGWAFPKDSPYKEKFDRLFQRLKEAGLIRKWMKDLIRLSASESTDSSASSFEEEEKGLQAFTVYHLQGVFFLMVGGYLLAGFILVVEIFFGKKEIHN